MIRYKVKTYLEAQAGKFVVEFSILDSIGGLSLFVYSAVAGARIAALTERMTHSLGPAARMSAVA